MKEQELEDFKLASQEIIGNKEEIIKKLSYEAKELRNTLLSSQSDQKMLQDQISSLESHLPKASTISENLSLIISSELSKLAPTSSYLRLSDFSYKFRQSFLKFVLSDQGIMMAPTTPLQSLKDYLSKTFSQDSRSKSAKSPSNLKTIPKPSSKKAYPKPTFSAPNTYKNSSFSSLSRSKPIQASSSLKLDSPFSSV